MAVEENVQALVACGVLLPPLPGHGDGGLRLLPDGDGDPKDQEGNLMKRERETMREKGSHLMCVFNCNGERGKQQV